MSYSEFKTISQVQEKFGLTVKESANLFVDIQPFEIKKIILLRKLVNYSVFYLFLFSHILIW
jgi:hypothetical protein